MVLRALAHDNNEEQKNNLLILWHKENIAFNYEWISQYLLYMHLKQNTLMVSM